MTESLSLSRFLLRKSSKVLIQAIKHNINRFPADFMFQLAQDEFQDLRSQNVTSSWDGQRYLPYIFDEKIG